MCSETPNMFLGQKLQQLHSDLVAYTRPVQVLHDSRKVVTSTVSNSSVHTSLGIQLPHNGINSASLTPGMKGQPGSDFILIS